MTGTIWDPTIPDTAVVSSLANKPGGVGIWDVTTAGVAYLKSLVSGTDIDITDNGDGTITIDFTGSSGGGDLTAQIVFSAKVTDTTFVAVETRNNYAPAGIATASRLFIESLTGGASHATITGITSGTDGKLLFITNRSQQFEFILVDESGASTAANRFAFTDIRSGSPVNFTLATGETALFIYDGALSRWRFICSSQPASHFAITGDVEISGTSASVITSTSGQFGFGDIPNTAPQITSNQNDYDPPNLRFTNVLDISSDAARNITGIKNYDAADTSARFLILNNVGSFNITLVASSASSIAANRFNISANIVIPSKGSVTLLYDVNAGALALGWKCIGKGF